MNETEPLAQNHGLASVRRLPALFLFFLPAISVELLTGNVPLSTYFNPFVFVTLNVIYGAAVVLVRETVVRWNKGITSILLFGVAYGMVNEGIGSKGFFDPHFYSVVQLGLENVGRIFGINVAWAFSITVFHALYSITVPLLLVDAVFPDKRPWLGRTAFCALLGVFAAVNAFAYFHVNHANIPAPGTLALVLVLMLAFAAAAKAMPDFKAAKLARPPRTWALFAFGLLSGFGVIVAGWGVYRVIPSLLVHCTVLAGLLIFLAWAILKLPAISGRTQVVLVAGILAPVIFSAVTHGNLIPPAAIIALLAACWRAAGVETITSFY